MELHRFSQVYRRYYHRIYPWTALNKLDRKVVPRLGSDPGFFIEVGANDGVRQSNTYYLEKRRGWTGLLVEPVPYLADLCKRNRGKSVVRNCALVAPEMHGSELEFLDLDLMSMVDAGTSTKSKERLELAESTQKIERQMISVPGVTLDSILAEIGEPDIDFFSLDVEGFEIDVLRGFNLEVHCPRFLLIETAQIDQVRHLVNPHLVLETQLSHHDYLFVRR
jgi:FkbM family methyltransferase